MFRNNIKTHITVFEVVLHRNILLIIQGNFNIMTIRFKNLMVNTVKLS